MFSREFVVYAMAHGSPSPVTGELTSQFGHTIYFLSVFTMGRLMLLGNSIFSEEKIPQNLNPIIFNQLKSYDDFRKVYYVFDGQWDTQALHNDLVSATLVY